ncbi:MAG: hypothetical protein ACI9F9_003260 [Candidatus Paceibacteria bacterium]|jgi:hypothetical protein
MLMLHATLVTLFGLGSCGGSDEAREKITWPTGVVLAVGGVPIHESEVDAHIDALLDIKPEYIKNHRRRLLLINWTFPMARGIQVSGADRKAARLEALDWMAAQEMAPGAPPAAMEGDLVGNWDLVGFDTWLMARELEIGDSSGLVELPGQYAIIRMIDRDRPKNKAHEQMVLRVRTFPYVDSPKGLLEECMESSLEIVDPAWNEIVPGTYKYKMLAE